MVVDDATMGRLTFEVDARHIRQLGRELVGDRITAVSELIKNSYDADATHVKVSFSTRAGLSVGGDLTIIDDGCGMTLDDIRRRWMVISTAFKSLETLSPAFGRQRAGRKGIGRFSAESLGERLLLSTTVLGSTERTCVEFIWERYSRGTRLQEVVNDYYTQSCGADEHGTVLQITRLHDTWTQSDFDRIREAVFLLQPPFAVADLVSPTDSQGDPGFSVTLQYGDDELLSVAEGNIDDIYEAATAWVSAEITDDGTAIAMLDSEHLNISDEFTTEEPILTVGTCRFQAAYFIFRRDALNPTSSLGVRRAQQLAATFGGIRVYRDGLRVMPYGEQRNDWLELDALYRERQVLPPIGNKNFFGEVLLTFQENPLIVDTASREGVIENEAFKELCSFLRDTLVWAVMRVASVRKRKPKAGTKADRTTTRAKIVGKLKRAVDTIDSAQTEQERGRALSELVDLVAEVGDQADTADEREAEERRRFIDEVTLMRVLASLGGSIAVFTHEVGAVLAQSEAALGDVIDLYGSLEELEAAESSLHSLGELTAYLNMYTSLAGRRKREPLAMLNLVEGFVGHVGPLLERRGIRSLTRCHLLT